MIFFPKIPGFHIRELSFRPKGQITHLCSSNGEMLLVIDARQLLHYPLQNTNRQIGKVIAVDFSNIL